MAELSGLMTAMVTPFGSDGELELGSVAPYLQFQRSAGIDGVVVCGTNGEGPSLSVAERMKVLEAVLRQREELQVVAGTGTANLPDTIALTRHAAECGADAALILPPFYFKRVSAQGVAEYFRRVLDAVDIPVLLYSIPQQSAIQVSDETLDLLAAHPRLAGMKDSEGDWARTSGLIERRKGLRIFPGSDELLSRSLAAGAAGSISGTANAFPELVVGVRRALAEGVAEEAQRRLDAAKSILLAYPLIAAAKSVLAHRGVPRMWVRPPLVDLTESQEREMISRFRGAGLL